MEWNQLSYECTQIETCIETVITSQNRNGIIGRLPKRTSNENEICLVDTQQDKVFIFNKNFEYLRETSKTRPKTCIFFEDKLILTWKGRMSVLNSKDFKEEQHFLGSFQCLTRNEEVIYATEEIKDDTKFVKIQRVDGIFQKSYLQNFTLKNVKVRYMTVFQGKIFCTDMNKNTVIGLDLSSMQISKSSYNMKLPAGIVVNNESVICCDRLNHRIVVFTLDLQYKDVLYHSTNMLYPNALINDGKSLLVAFQHTRGQDGPADGCVVKLAWH